jgi:hypothetical protein
MTRVAAFGRGNHLGTQQSEALKDHRSRVQLSRMMGVPIVSAQKRPLRAGHRLRLGCSWR